MVGQSRSNRDMVASTEQVVDHHAAVRKPWRENQALPVRAPLTVDSGPVYERVLGDDVPELFHLSGFEDAKVAENGVDVLAGGFVKGVDGCQGNIHTVDATRPLIGVSAQVDPRLGVTECERAISAMMSGLPLVLGEAGRSGVTGWGGGGAV
jgi:hypothetical protein